MATLLGVYHGDRCVGTCDARCYGARHRDSGCLCICGGKNHGVGLAQAEANIDAGVGGRADLELYAPWYGLTADDLVVIDRRRVPGLKRARSLAEHELYMRRHQLELPFETPP